MYYPLIDGMITRYLRREGKTQRQMAAELGMTEVAFSWKREGVLDFSLGEAARVARICCSNISLVKVLEGARAGRRG